MKLIPTLLTTSIISFAIASSHATAANLTFYKDDSYSGRLAPYNTSDSIYVTYSRHSDSNDEVSSMLLSNGCVILAEHGDLNGKWLIENGNIPSLSPFGMNDKISSFAMFEPSFYHQCKESSIAVMYEHGNGSGRKYPLVPGAIQPNIGYFNDKASSVYIPARTNITFYEHSSLRGASITLSGNGGIIDLHAHGWGDRASSFSVDAY